MTRKTVIFDIGATLVSGPNRGPASRIAAGLDLNFAQKKTLQSALMTRNWESSEAVVEFAVNTFGMPGASIRETINRVWQAQQSDATPIQGAHSVLSMCAEAGVQIALISNIWHPFLISVRRGFGLFFDDHIPERLQFFSYREGVAKPSEDIFRRALMAAGAQPHQTIMIGDSYREDIETAIALGLRTVWLLHRPADEVGNIERILNGASPRPSLSLASIEDLDRDLLEALIFGRQPRTKHQEAV